ncbi:membrane fusion protein, copper/silver efflux system [Janthinobacterium sp. CG_23.3]|uniref:efflux RND transporter periplasmic adaptor subunit n=1 Tax=Janthinobacterium sp. CG_23.3 TaxID=3349634 RepID=UPI0038D40844
MKHQKIVLALAAAGAVAAAAAGYGLYRAGVNQGMGTAAPAAAGADTATGKKVLYWHDPMVPGQKFDKPGKSPFMDMQLVPVYAGDAGDEGRVSISPRVQQNLGVRTARVVKGSLSAPFDAAGGIAYNERDVALVQARGNGFVERLYVRAPLDPVRKGQPLAELYVPEWVAAQEEYISVRRMTGAGADGLLDAARQRMRLVGMTDEQIRLVEASGKTHARLRVTAPIGGVVTELGAREGMTVAAGATLFRINGLDTVWVNAEVPESLAARVRPGSAVEARTPALPDLVFKGTVGAILPEVSGATRTLKARVELANPGGRLVPGMFAAVRLSPDARNDVLLVPSEAVIQTGTRSVVMLAQGGGKFLPADVEVGAEANGQSEIRKGLEEGQDVVVSGQFLIDSEASLKGTATRMGGMPEPDGAGKPAPAPHRGEGRVEAIGKDDITLSHGPIPSLQWGAMTMAFKPPPGGLPRNVAVGDSVAFEVRQNKDGAYQLTSISPTAAAPPPGRKDGQLGGVRPAAGKTGQPGAAK